MKRLLTGLVVLLCMTPARALGQACIGIPTLDRQFALTASLGLPEDAKTYTGGLHADLRGPLSVGGQLSLTKPDNDVIDDIMTIGGHLLYELRNPSISLCPVVGLQYSQWDDEFGAAEVNVSVLSIPIGLGIGKTLRASGVDITLFGVPQYVYSRASFEIESGAGEAEDTDTESDFAVTGGARLSGRMLFGGLSIAMSSADDWDDPVLTLTLGLIFGNR